MSRPNSAGTSPTKHGGARPGSGQKKADTVPPLLKCMFTKPDGTYCNIPVKNVNNIGCHWHDEDAQTVLGRLHRIGLDIKQMYPLIFLGKAQPEDADQDYNLTQLFGCLKTIKDAVLHSAQLRRVINGEEQYRGSLLALNCMYATFLGFVKRLDIKLPADDLEWLEEMSDEGDKNVAKAVAEAFPNTRRIEERIEEAKATMATELERKAEREEKEATKLRLLNDVADLTGDISAMVMSPTDPSPSASHKMDEPDMMLISPVGQPPKDTIKAIRRKTTESSDE